MADADTAKGVAEQIGKSYVESHSLPDENGRITKIAYNEIADIVVELFQQIQVPVVFQKADPYDSYEHMAETVAKEQMLRVYNQHTDHPYFSHMEQLAFRAVHDWFGHLEADVDFSPEGEFKKWDHMNQYFESDEQKRVMFAEVVGQVGAVHYLPDGFASDRCEQRAFMAPNHWVSKMIKVVRDK